MTRFFVTTLVTLLSVATIATEKSNNTVKLYALNCGTTQVSDMKDFSVKGKMNGEKETLIVPCYLIRHPKGDLLWELLCLFCHDHEHSKYLEHDRYGSVVTPGDDTHEVATYNPFADLKKIMDCKK